MFLPYRLLLLELQRIGCLKSFLQYQKFLCKVENHSLRIQFLNNCFKADLIPRFLKFRVPNNGCFDDQSVHTFQKRLLRREIARARKHLEDANDKLNGKRSMLTEKAPLGTIASIALYSRQARLMFRAKQSRIHNKKLSSLSDEQERPLFSVDNTVFTYRMEENPPQFVMETLLLGSKNPVLTKFDQKDVLAELGELLVYCRKNGVDDATITDINVKTLNYIKKCKKQHNPTHIQKTSFI